MELKGLDPSDVLGLLAQARGRNAYGPKLMAFIESDEAGVNVAEVWPEFAGKIATTLYQGFRTAREKAQIEDGVVTILNRDGQVYLIHNERAHLLAAEAAVAA